MRHEIQKNHHNAATPLNLRKYTANNSENITSKDQIPLTRECISTRMNNNNDYLYTTLHSCSSSNSSSPSPSLSLNKGSLNFCKKSLTSSAVMKLCFEEPSSINQVLNGDNDSTLVTADTTLVEVSNPSPNNDTMVTTRSKLKKQQQIESLASIFWPYRDDEKRIYHSNTPVSCAALENIALSHHATNITTDNFQDDSDLVSLVHQSLAASSVSKLHTLSLYQNQSNKVIYLK